MKFNRLGNTGLFVSELGLGTMTFGENRDYPLLGGVGQQEANAFVSHALESGVNLFDTADGYSLGSSEQILGKALRNSGVQRESYLIATKAFLAMGSGPNDAGSSRGHLLNAAKGSLKRLGVDYIDIYQLHGFDPATPIEESLRAIDDLVRQGLVRYVGVSNWAAWQIAKALGISERLGLTRFSSLQAYYSVVGRDLEQEIAPMLLSEGVGLIVWSPLAGGFLSGKRQRDMPEPEGSRRSAMQFPPIDGTRGFETLDVLRSIADAHDASVAQISLAWLLSQRAVSSVLIGAKRMDQLEDNLKAAELQLTQHELNLIARVSGLPANYPRWMLDFQGAERNSLLVQSNW
ncbi:aldo/keto reductase [Xanthomonas sp. NCPPB 2654]|uniref:aldo/keto reductase n=1 Tax=unclassified Xanthomonas TaxID=2643310 RepID=UPI0021DF5BAA|nr:MULTISPECIES: aldo/keto reductase [unclassified Xanthomonas]MDL5364226.1 aldo/keto reductase [Xanthomonas sp. NCPPB 2654]UYC20475.1 aldo/keto reductase [Xanthomonas sp. CFBP 8443]